MIEKEMFEEIMKLFPNFNYHNEFYDEYRSQPTVDSLIQLAHSQLSESFGRKIIDYGATYRAALDPEIGDDFSVLEKKDDEIFEEFIKFFDFYYKYRGYSEEFKHSNFEEYLRQSQ